MPLTLARVSQLNHACIPPLLSNSGGVGSSGGEFDSSSSNSHFVGGSTMYQICPATAMAFELLAATQASCKGMAGGDLHGTGEVGIRSSLRMETEVKVEKFRGEVSPGATHWCEKARRCSDGAWLPEGRRRSTAARHLATTTTGRGVAERLSLAIGSRWWHGGAGVRGGRAAAGRPGRAHDGRGLSAAGVPARARAAAGSGEGVCGGGI